ncbi:uncharacterized protein [Clytia hemisphaerica]|uniref:Uncharacterized protein n=1 Tax=Clytia hemisphaerica TaxID=252671 RepID=A0A7M5VBB2_9CNID
MNRRGGETAAFDFRDNSSASETSIFSTVSWYRLEYAFESVRDCLKQCCCMTRKRHESMESDTEDDNEDRGGNDHADTEDTKPLFPKATISINTLKRKNKKSKKKEYKRKISYYGTVHRNLAQQTDPIVDE